MYKTKEELVKAAGLKTFDYALPQIWLDHMKSRTTETMNISDHFVWTYDFYPTTGSPFPISKTGIIILSKYTAFFIKN